MPQRSVAAPASQSIGNVSAAAPALEIKLLSFEEDMQLAWFNQAEAYFLSPARRCRPDVLVLLNAVGTDASAEEVGLGLTINPGPTT